MTDITPERLTELLEAGKRFAGDPNLYRQRFFDIVTRKDGVERRYEGEWVRDVMRDLPSLAARVIELEGENARLREEALRETAAVDEIARLRKDVLGLVRALQHIADMPFAGRDDDACSKDDAYSDGYDAAIDDASTIAKNALDRAALETANAE